MTTTSEPTAPLSEPPQTPHWSTRTWQVALGGTPLLAVLAYAVGRTADDYAVSVIVLGLVGLALVAVLAVGAHASISRDAGTATTVVALFVFTVVGAPLVAGALIKGTADRVEAALDDAFSGSDAYTQCLADPDTTFDDCARLSD